MDGDITDLIAFADSLNLGESGCGLDILDPQRDITVLDPEFVPCSALEAHYFANGFDITRVLVAMDGRDLYLGLRAAGSIGDTDGDGSPDGTCGTSSIWDEPGIGPDDRYVWHLDTNCSQTFSPDITVSISANALHATGIEYDEATFRFHGTDIEVKLSNVHLPSGATMSGFSARAAANSNSDGLSEDSSAALTCPPLSVSVEVHAESSPPEICRGGVLTVDLVILNTGMARLGTVQMEDSLPAGFTYLPGSTSGIGEPTMTGSGELEFPEIALNPGETRPIRFQARAGTRCYGEASNLARVAARATNECYPSPGFLDATDSKESPVTCLSAACHGEVKPGPVEVLQARNYPNPILGGSTSIYYTVPTRASGSHVEIAIFDAGGRLVRRIVPGEWTPGAHAAVWDLSDDKGDRVAAGIYFYSVRAGGEKLTRKMVVVRG